MTSPLRRLSAAALLATGLSTQAPAYDTSTSSVNEAPTAGAMVFDLIVVRPLALVTTVLGTGVFIVQLPFDIGQEDGVKTPFEKLVKEPARYTFTRPLGSTE